MLAAVRVAGRPLAAILVAGLIASTLSCAREARLRAPAPMPITAAELRSMAGDPGRKVLLVNVWATWCEPCREELPALVRLRREMTSEGVDIVLVSADFDKTTEELVTFLAENGIDFPTYLKTERDEDFIAGLDEDWSGAIPATFLHVRGRPVDFWEGAATHEAFARKVKEALILAAQDG